MDDKNIVVYENTEVDPESGNVVRYTDNGPKDGDLPGISPEEIDDFGSLTEAIEAMKVMLNGNS